ncbi:MAG TPA: zf-HC2 domain-containing protein [Gemmatimonadales bacterium]|nr:zf-HC2 domain-containing protein [Gemmatimonadales bacterium]
MRHIPEDELHAYLDQGLSRSQAVEIESHLAGCSSCRASRDAIAALRDRTTALLATLSPPRGLPPAFDTLRELAADRVNSRRRQLRVGAWAASLVAAVGLGWTASALVGPGRTGPATQREASAVPSFEAPSPVASVAAADTAEPARVEAPAQNPTPARVADRTPQLTPVRHDSQRASAARQAMQQAREDSIRAAKLAVLDPAPVLELTPLEERGSEQGEPLEGMWRTMSWDGAQSETGRSVPHIDGLPVLRVQVQATDQSKRPLMVVAQQLADGQVIQTIEGPAADVSQLLSRRGGTSADGKLGVIVSEATPGIDQAMAMQLGDRMLAITGALPSDSLRAMIRRINAEMRSK